MAYNPQNPNGQATSTNSAPVVIASDQSVIPISATSLPLPTGASTETTLTSLNTKVTAVNTGAVTISTPLPTGTNTIGAVTSNIGTTGGLALDATLIGGTQKAIARTATKGTSTAADVTSDATDVNTQALHVNLKGVHSTVPVTGAFFQTTQPVSGPLTDTQLRATAVSVSGTVTSNVGTTGGLALDSTLTGGTSKSIVRSATKGTAVAADITSNPVDANTQALHVNLSGVNAVNATLTAETTKVIGTVNVSAGQTIAAVTAITNALPTGANVIGALTANQSVNSTQINGVALLAGNGVTGVGSQRVTIASDNTAFAVNSTLTAETTKVIGTVNISAAQTIAAVTAITNALPTGTNAIGSVTQIGNALVSTTNSTTTNLAAGGTFTGTGEDVSEYSTVMVTIFSSHVSATDGFQLQFSSDGTNWDYGDSFSIPATTGKTFSVGVTAKFYRVVYTNGATATTSLRIQSLYSKAAKKNSSVRPQDGRTNDNDFEEVLSFGVGYNGTSWDRVRLSAKGVQATTALATQDLKDSGRARVSITFMAVAPAVADTLLTLVKATNGVAAAGATSIGVAAGKTLRITSITFSIKANAAAAAFATLTFRQNPVGATAIGSVAEYRVDVGNTAATIGAADKVVVEFPDGMEFSGAQTLGISLAAQAITNIISISLNGFEY